MTKNPPTVDFFIVPCNQVEIDRRLENWARWVQPGYAMQICPMFRLARSNTRQWHAPVLMPSVDSKDAHQIEKIIGTMPVRHAAALRWFYVFRSGEKHARKVLGETREGLYKLVCDARQIVMNKCR